MPFFEAVFLLLCLWEICFARSAFGSTLDKIIQLELSSMPSEISNLDFPCNLRNTLFKLGLSFSTLASSVEKVGGVAL